MLILAFTADLVVAQSGLLLIHAGFLIPGVPGDQKQIVLLVGFKLNKILKMMKIIQSFN